MVKYDYEKLWVAMKNIVGMNAQYNRNMCDIYSSCNLEKKPPEHIVNAYYAWADAAELMNSLEEQNKIEVEDNSTDEDKEDRVENIELNEEYE